MTYHPAILRELFCCEVGSSAHGVNLPGKDDLDWGGVVVERPVYVFGSSTFEQHIYRTAAEREQKHNAPSQPGDIDLTLYSLRKFARLAGKGNPSVLLLLFAPLLTCTDWGRQLRQQSDLFASKEAGHRFLGYLIAQRERLLGLRGQKDVKRPELVERFGYDTKYAMHMLRLGYQGIEYLQTGHLLMPMAQAIREYLLGVRNGLYPEQDLVKEAMQLEAELRRQLNISRLPDHPDWTAIDKLVTGIYRDVWTYERAF